jgi:hypothetical protein
MHIKELKNSRYIFVLCSLIVTVVSIHNSLHLVTAASDWDNRAEAQFEFSKFIKKFRSALEDENPQTIMDYKKVILQLIPEYRQILERLEPTIKSEFCKIASTSPEYPVDCSNVLGESLPLPTSKPGVAPSPETINNSSSRCIPAQENNTLPSLEVGDFQNVCNGENVDLESKIMPKSYNDTSAERAQERLFVGCESLKLLSNETQSMLRSMDNNNAKCYEDEKPATQQDSR